MQKRGLGRGLESLIPSISQGQAPPLIMQDEAGARLEIIQISKIVPNPNQPRKHFDEEAFAELVASVKEHGLIQPLIVRVLGSLYELVAGERRWRAAKEAGLKNIPAIVRDTSDVEALEIALVENIQRQDLNALEEAAAYYHLIEDFNFTQEQLSARVGKSRSAISNTIRLLRLPEPVKDLIFEGKLSAGHARALLGLTSEELQTRLAERIVGDGLSVRQAESLSRLWQNPPQKKPLKQTPLQYKILAKDLSKKLSTKVRLKVRGDNGRLEISFDSEEDLKRIIKIISGAEIDIEVI